MSSPQLCSVPCTDTPRVSPHSCSMHCSLIRTLLRNFTSILIRAPPAAMPLGPRKPKLRTVRGMCYERSPAAINIYWTSYLTLQLRKEKAKNPFLHTEFQVTYHTASNSSIVRIGVHVLRGQTSLRSELVTQDLLSLQAINDIVLQRESTVLEGMEERRKEGKKETGKEAISGF